MNINEIAENTAGAFASLWDPVTDLSPGGIGMISP